MTKNAQELRAELLSLRLQAEEAYAAWKRQPNAAARQRFQDAALAESQRRAEIGPLGNYQ